MNIIDSLEYNKVLTKNHTNNLQPRCSVETSNGFCSYHFTKVSKKLVQLIHVHIINISTQLHFSPNCVVFIAYCWSDWLNCEKMRMCSDREAVNYMESVRPSMSPEQRAGMMRHELSDRFPLWRPLKRGCTLKAKGTIWKEARYQTLMICD